jgi:hypothetical protein
MSMVIVIEIVAGILLLAAAVRFAVRDTRSRSGAPVEQQSAPAHVEVAERGSELKADQHMSEATPADSTT